MVQLLEDLDLAHGGDGEALRIVVHFDHLQRIEAVRALVSFYAGLVYFTESALADLGFVDEDGGLAQLQLVNRGRLRKLSEPRLG